MIRVSIAAVRAALARNRELLFSKEARLGWAEPDLVALTQA